MHPTTGILAVFVALNYCDVVHIAGFGYPNSKTLGQPIHYYRNDTMKSMKVGRSQGSRKVSLFGFTDRIITEREIHLLSYDCIHTRCNIKMVL